AAALQSALQVARQEMARPAHASNATVVSDRRPAPNSMASVAPVRRVVSGDRNRTRMLEKGQIFWVKGVLEQSLYSAVVLDVGMAYQPNAVERPWNLVVQQPDQPHRPLPSDTRISAVYDDAGGELLILGSSGAGKTTLLLELARDLLDRAEQDETHPIPVV